MTQFTSFMLQTLFEKKHFHSDTYTDVDGYPELVADNLALNRERTAKALEQQSGLPSARFKT